VKERVFFIFISYFSFYVIHGVSRGKLSEPPSLANEYFLSGVTGEFFPLTLFVPFWCQKGREELIYNAPEKNVLFAT